MAEQLMKSALDLDGALGKIDTLISSIPHEAERKKFACALGEIIGHINDAFIRPIAREHPDLDPDK